jgi:hypothetical protein
MSRAELEIIKMKDEEKQFNLNLDDTPLTLE